MYSRELILTYIQKYSGFNFPILDKILEGKISLIDSLLNIRGSNRENKLHCQIRAINDIEAVQCWLDEYKNNKGTYRIYKKEIERFVLWCIYQNGKLVSSLDKIDFEKYFEFLDNPQPSCLWCSRSGGRGNVRGSKNWKPFIGALSHHTKLTSISIINTFITYLVNAHYLAYNPLILVRNIKKYVKNDCNGEQYMKIQAKILEEDEFLAIIESANDLPETSMRQKDDKQRIIFLIKILFFLGLRIHELETHTWAHFKQLQGKWWFFVLGKGNKWGKIPVNDELLQSIIQYRSHLRFTPYPGIDEQDKIRPIIQSWNHSGALTARYMNKLLKKIALLASKKFDNIPNKIAKLSKFSAHWLRHLSASMQDKYGVSFNNIKANLRHENDNTTRLYIHAIDNHRHEDMQKLHLPTSLKSNNDIINTKI